MKNVIEFVSSILAVGIFWGMLASILNIATMLNLTWQIWIISIIGAIATWTCYCIIRLFPSKE